MQPISAFDAAFRFTLPQVQLRGWWVAPALVGVGVVLGFTLAMDQHASARPASAAPATFAAGALTPYASSDPSVPSADTVRFAEPEAPVDTF